MTASSPWVRTTRAAAPTSTSLRVLSGPITASSATTVAPSSCTPGRIVTSWSSLTSTSFQGVSGGLVVYVDPCGVGVDDRVAVLHPTSQDAAVLPLGQSGELGPVVRALGLEHV